MVKTNSFLSTSFQKKKCRLLIITENAARHKYFTRNLKAFKRYLNSYTFTLERTTPTLYFQKKGTAKFK